MVHLARMPRHTIHHLQLYPKRNRIYFCQHMEMRRGFNMLKGECFFFKFPMLKFGFLVALSQRAERFIWSLFVRALVSMVVRMLLGWSWPLDKIFSDFKNFIGF